MRAFPEPALGPAITAALLLVASTLGWPAPTGHIYSNGPPPAHTGGFGEPTCHACHFENRINDPTGDLELLGLPTSYEPGRTYSIAVVVHHPALRRAGFQLSARFAEGDSAGRQAGLVAALDRRALVTEAGDPAVLFIQNTGPGSRALTPGSSRWTVEWRAPSSQQGVVFHVAGNAANDDSSELGDYVYAEHITIPAQPRADR